MEIKSGGSATAAAGGLDEFLQTTSGGARTTTEVGSEEGEERKETGITRSSCGRHLGLHLRTAQIGSAAAELPNRKQKHTRASSSSTSFFSGTLGFE